MAFLHVTNESTVTLTGLLDAASDLDLSHASGNLSSNDDALVAEDEGSSIRIEVKDFVDGSTTWTISASHEDPPRTTNTWSRGTDLAYFDFAVFMTDYIAVTVVATAGAATKEKIIDIKTKPEGALPDR